jgi:hypothetical protein
MVFSGRPSSWIGYDYERERRDYRDRSSARAGQGAQVTISNVHCSVLFITQAVGALYDESKKDHTWDARFHPNAVTLSPARVARLSLLNSSVGMPCGRRASRLVTLDAEPRNGRRRAVVPLPGNHLPASIFEILGCAARSRTEQRGETWRLKQSQP